MPGYVRGISLNEHNIATSCSLLGKRKKDATCGNGETPEDQCNAVGWDVKRISETVITDSLRNHESALAGEVR